MTSVRVQAFCDWWSSLQGVSLPHPSASVQEEHRHRHYYVFAENLKKQWDAGAVDFARLLKPEEKRLSAVVQASATALAQWIEEVGRPALLRVLNNLTQQDDVLLQLFGDRKGSFHVGALKWLDDLSVQVEMAASSPLAKPPYLTLGVQAGRPELPLHRSTGVWANTENNGNWPWRNPFLVRSRLLELQDFGEDAWPVMELLVKHCDPPWCDALRQVPASTATVQLEVASSAWTAALVLTLIMEPGPRGSMSLDAHDWAQQLLAPYQTWYFGNGGAEDREPDSKGVVVVNPIRALNTAFVPPDPAVTYYASSHVRDYCLFLRFLADRVTDAAKSLLCTREAAKRPKRTREELRALAVKELRLNPNLTQREFADLVGESEATISRKANFNELRRLVVVDQLAASDDVELNGMQVRRRPN